MKRLISNLQTIVLASILPAMDLLQSVKNYNCFHVREQN